LNIKIIYDNRPSEDGWQTGWGFSCLVENRGKLLLFDTGDDGEKLLINLEKNGIELNNIEALTFSHNHWDHTGGAESFLKKNKSAKVFIPYNFPALFKTKTKLAGHFVETAGKVQTEIFPGIYTTPVFKRFMRTSEQGVVIKSSKGYALITGCAHPGIVFMVKKAKEIFKDTVKMVIGGFHFRALPAFTVRKIINKLKNEGVEYFAPAHCTGDKAIEIFQKECGEGFIRVGSGKNIEW